MTGKDTILSTSMELFYRNGYTNTGVAEILKSCNLSKPSLYHHFGSKTGLGFAYLEVMQKELFSRIQTWVQKRNSLQEYLDKWLQHIKRSIKQGTFYGCPFASFSYQLSQKDMQIFSPKMQQIMQDWLDILTSFIKKLQVNGLVRHDCTAKDIAFDMLSIYQGNVTLWKLTQSKTPIQAMERQFQNLNQKVSIIL
ncbi:MAG: TetR/AcrR family transcriptional regulator [Spirochaetota bacterium]